MSNSIQPKPTTVVVVTPPPLPLSLMQRLSRALTRPAVAIPVAVFALALLGWSFLYRLPNAPVVIKARSLQTLGSNEVFRVQTLVELEDAGQRAAKHLIRDSKEIATALSHLEQSARALGFQIEVSMKLAITNAAGFKELTIHPAVVRLENDYKQDRPAFARALDWLRQARTLPGKIEVNALNLRSNGDGLTRAQLELHFWRMNEHEQSAAK